MDNKLNDIELYKMMKSDPRIFIRLMWGLVPERDNSKFVKGKHITWQQDDILLAVKSALEGGKKRISVKSGHGIGKSCTLAWLVLWYLFCFKDAQIPVTAPTADQMYDVLWKEIQIWLQKMPANFQAKYEWSTTYIRVTESPQTWFARAKTARKEAPEALAGIHADNVMIIADEASGIDDAIFHTAEGAMTSSNVIQILISNPTRLTGFFYETFHKDKANWTNLEFSCVDAPPVIVDRSYIERIIEKHGEESDEYKIRVLGQFPDEGSADDKGYVPLINQFDIKLCDKIAPSQFIGNPKMGIDPSGEGDDETVWVVRDNFKAMIVAKEKKSTPKSIATKTITLMDYYGVHPEDVMIDNFGEGADVAKEIALSSFHYDVGTINVGDASEDEEMSNIRAEAFMKMRDWIKHKAELVKDKGWDELLTLRYRRNLRGKVQIMPKVEMKRNSWESPNCADALMLTFVRESEERRPQAVTVKHNRRQWSSMPFRVKR